MLDRLLNINREAFAAGEYEVAYHVLMAALHLVDHARDREGLERVAQAAREEGAAVEALQPPHHLARSQAQLRGQIAVFDSLRVHLDAVRLRMQGAAQVAGRSGAPAP